MLSYIVIATLLPALILSYPIIECGPGQPTPRALRIQGCPSSPCSVQRGAVIPFESDLTANEDTATLRLEVDVTAFGETTPYPIPEPLRNVCNFLSGGSCPLTAGALVTQIASFPVIVEFQGGIPITLRSRIYNASGTMMSCSIIEARVY